jgi:hypothetical protein
MDWTVVWVPDAEQELAQLWFSATDRDRITLAAAELERRLRHDPETAGESRAPGRRILIAPPLAATFRVSPADRLVQILNLREFRPKRSQG